MVPEPIFGSSVNPNSTGEGRLSPPITTGPHPDLFHLPAPLTYVHYFSKTVISDSISFKNRFIYQPIAPCFENLKKTTNAEDHEKQNYSK